MLKFYFPFLLTIMFLNATYAQTPARLIQETYGRYNTSTGKHDKNADTTSYIYSFGRGSNMKTGVIQYDTAISKHFGGTSTHYATYDNASRLKTRGYNAWQSYQDTLFYIGSNAEPDSLVSYGPFPKEVAYEKYLYNASRNLVRRVRKFINAKAEVSKDSFNYTYTGSNLTHQDWYRDVKNAGYTFINSTTTTFNAANKPLVITTSANEKLTYTYNTNNTVNTLTQEYYTSGSYQNNSKHSYVYNTLNDVIIDSTFYWVSTSSQWKLYYTNHYSYDASRNRIADSIFHYHTTPSNFRKKTMSYNTNNDPLVIQYFSWNSATSTWTSLSDADSLFTYTYQPYNPTSVQENTQAQLRIYPNPASAYISFDVNADWECKSYSIFDVSGRIHRHQSIGNTIQNQHTIPIADLPIGVYILTIDTKDNRIQKTFIKE